MKNIFLIPFIFILACSNKNIPNVDHHNTRNFQFTYEVLVEPTHGNKLEIWLPVPTSSNVQEISNLQIISEDLAYTLKDEPIHGNRYLYVFSKMGITNPTTITMTFDVHRKEHSNISDKNADPNNYLGSYSNVPTGNIFSKIINENDLSQNDIRGIYNFVFEGMHYGKPKTVDNIYYRSPWLNSDSIYGQKGVTRDDVVKLYQQSKNDGGDYTFGKGNSIYACDIGVGNCTDYHSYFMSLGRTLGVPVRFHMGFPIPSESEGAVGGYHCWADYYIEGEGWYPVDISEGDKDPQRKDYYFGTLDNNRVEMILGRDIKLEGYEMETTNLFIYPIMEINDQTSSAFSKSFKYKEI